VAGGHGAIPREDNAEDDDEYQFVQFGGDDDDGDRSGVDDDDTNEGLALALQRIQDMKAAADRAKNKPPPRPGQLSGMRGVYSGTIDVLQHALDNTGIGLGQSPDIRASTSISNILTILPPEAIAELQLSIGRSRSQYGWLTRSMAYHIADLITELFQKKLYLHGLGADDDNVKVAAEFSLNEWLILQDPNQPLPVDLPRVWQDIEKWAGFWNPTEDHWMIAIAEHLKIQAPDIVIGDATLDDRERRVIRIRIYDSNSDETDIQLRRDKARELVKLFTMLSHHPQSKFFGASVEPVQWPRTLQQTNLSDCGIIALMVLFGVICGFLRSSDDEATSQSTIGILRGTPREVRLRLLVFIISLLPAATQLPDPTLAILEEDDTGSESSSIAGCHEWWTPLDERRVDRDDQEKQSFHPSPITDAVSGPFTDFEPNSFIRFKGNKLTIILSCTRNSGERGTANVMQLLRNCHTGAIGFYQAFWPGDVSKSPIEICSDNASQDRVAPTDLPHERITLSLNTWSNPDDPGVADLADEEEIVRVLMPRIVPAFAEGQRMFYITYAAEARTSRALAPFQDVDISDGAQETLKDRFIQRLLKALDRLATREPEYFDATEVALLSYGADAIFSCMEQLEFWTATIPNLDKTLTISTAPGHELPFTVVRTMFGRQWATFDLDLLAELGKWCSVNTHPDCLVSNPSRGTIFKPSPNPHLQAILVYFRLQYWKYSTLIATLVEYALGRSFASTNSRAVEDWLADEERICSNLQHDGDHWSNSWEQSELDPEGFICAICAAAERRTL